MSTDTPANAPSPVPPALPATPPNSDAEAAPSSIFLVSYPKIIFLYPTLIFAFLSGLLMLALGEGAEGKSGRVEEVVSLLFLMLTALNLVVLSFDFPRTTSLTIFFGFSAVVMGFVLLLTNRPDLIPAFSSFFGALKPRANAQFYFLFSLLMSLLYMVVWLLVRFDYWEVRPNELLHHHGFMSDLERFSAPNLRISKEINDVFEYMLLRSGRLILHPTSEPRAFVLDNVLNINRKEAQITKMLGALQVELRTEAPRTPQA
jgi:hypothetical protein